MIARLCSIVAALLAATFTQAYAQRGPLGGPPCAPGGQGLEIVEPAGPNVAITKDKPFPIHVASPCAIALGATIWVEFEFKKPSANAWQPYNIMPFAYAKWANSPAVLTVPESSWNIYQIFGFGSDPQPGHKIRMRAHCLDADYQTKLFGRVFDGAGKVVGARSRQEQCRSAPSDWKTFNVYKSVDLNRAGKTGPKF